MYTSSKFVQVKGFDIHYTLSLGLRHLFTSTLKHDGASLDASIMMTQFTNVKKRSTTFAI